LAARVVPDVAAAGGVGLGAERGGPSGRPTTGAARPPRVPEARFSLAFDRTLRNCGERNFGPPVPGGAVMGGENLEVRRTDRMTKTITMAAITAGHAEGGTALNAFDNALLAAGIGNINLVKVSSILPPEVPVIELPKIKPGALIPTAYAAVTSETPGQTIAAAVGYAVPDDPAKNGVIMEFHGVATREEAERQIHLMLEEAFRVRGELIRDRGVVAVEHTVERIGCALAAMPLLADEDLV
jgi:arginine decarboxylase